jgi:hypothetical protein
MTTAPAGATHGPNIRGANQPYMGPRTPAGPQHRYHLQVFALDATLPADAGATFDSLTAAMKDHVLASGELIGLGQVDPSAPPPAPRGSPPAGTRRRPTLTHCLETSARRSRSADVIINRDWPAPANGPHDSRRRRLQRRLS